MIRVMAWGFILIMGICLFAAFMQDEPKPTIKLVPYADPNYVQSPHEAQERLKAQGYYNGKIDGIWGPESDRAFCDWCAVRATNEARGMKP